nr:hypothetical protein [Marinicella sp. W31]MDC2876111.1 hypothetical protein [Marinicella sp. W31]
MIDGRLPVAPKVLFGIVDVRDAADLHIAAMMAPEAAGQRFIAVSGAPLSLIQIAGTLRGLGSIGSRAPVWQPPDWAVPAMARFLPPLRQFVSRIGMPRLASSDKARTVLGWSPRPVEETIAATAESLVALNQ